MKHIFVRLIIGICIFPVMARAADNGVHESSELHIKPTEEQHDIPGKTRSMDEMKKDEAAHPNPPYPEGGIPFLPTTDPEKYKSEKDAATKRMKENLDKRWKTKPRQQ